MMASLSGSAAALALSLEQNKLRKLRNARDYYNQHHGNGCAISQASADMMLDLVIGKTKEEAGRLTGIFLKMIQGQAAPEELEELEEAVCLQDVAHMPARVKCAVLGWHTLEELLKTPESVCIVLPLR